VKRLHRFVVVVAVVVPSGACGDAPPASIEFPAMGALGGDGGKGSFRFGVATAATQIEDMNPATDWYLWTRRRATRR